MRGRKEALAAPLWDFPWNFPPDGANAFDPKKIQDSLNKSNSRNKRNSRTQTHHFIEVVFAVSAIFDVVHFQHLLLAQEPGHLRTENGENQQENGEKSFLREKKSRIPWQGLEFPCSPRERAAGTLGVMEFVLNPPNFGFLLVCLGFGVWKGDRG